MALEIYCDGACSGNHQKTEFRKSGIGIVFVEDEEVVHTVSENVNELISPEITNNRAELYGIYKSLDILDKDCEGFSTVVIYTDSRYSVDTLNLWLEKWRKKNKDYKNKDLIDKVDDLINKIRLKDIDLTIAHVYGHSVNKYNNLADKLAVKGADNNYFA